LFLHDIEFEEIMKNSNMKELQKEYNTLKSIILQAREKYDINLVITINNEYLKIFGFWHQRNQPESDFLEKELTKLLTLSESELQAEVDRRYEIAVGNHEISGWVDRLVSVLSGQAK
jgi:hypothetical protein